ncbi:hypothetical protein GA0115240_17608 [Streptomyces sp. DvalAA-14]|nr:hypothetical protein GA0115240_17608 [Streptomyces sp. DvalAA-14]
MKIPDGSDRRTVIRGSVTPITRSGDGWPQAGGSRQGMDTPKGTPGVSAG